MIYSKDMESKFGAMDQNIKEIFIMDWGMEKENIN